MSSWLSIAGFLLVLGGFWVLGWWEANSDERVRARVEQQLSHRWRPVPVTEPGREQVIQRMMRNYRWFCRWSVPALFPVAYLDALTLHLIAQL